MWDKSFPSSKSKKIPVDTALVIYTDCNLGRNTYTTQKRVLAAAAHDIFPAWGHLREKQKGITPNVMQIPPTFAGIHFTGVYYNLIEALQCTISRVLETAPEFESTDLNLMYKFGFDGSGGHSIFNQVNNDETNNLILTVVCPLELKDNFGQVVWTEPSPNAPKSQRPLMIQTPPRGLYQSHFLSISMIIIMRPKSSGFNLIESV